MNAQLMPRGDDSTAIQSIPAEPAPTFPMQNVTPAQLLTIAVQQNASLDRLEKLMDLRDRWEANEARKAYVAALAAFKGEPLAITKDKRVHFSAKNGGATTDYRHATIGNVVGVIAPALARHGLSHSWTPTREGPRIKVKCTLTHALGHSESVEMEGPLDESGNKNPIQQQQSTVTYLQRHTLLAITGVAVLDQDDDGRGNGSDDPEAEALANDWRECFAGCETVADLTARGKELARAKIEPKLKDALRRDYDARLQQLRAASIAK